jgi:hypothetical protein
MPSKVPDDEEGSRPHGMIERLIGAVTGLTLRNVLIIALLVAIAIPSGFMYLFFTNVEFRKQWLSYVLPQASKGIPCAVFVVSETRSGERTVVGTSFHADGDIEYFVIARSYVPLNADQLKATCAEVKKYTDILEKQT